MSAWLCPTELDRRRVSDAGAGVRRIRNFGALAVGAALLLMAPVYGAWTLALFAVVAVDYATIDWRMSRSRHPEIVSVVAIANTVVALAVGVALTGGASSPALPWLVMPAAMVAARFRPQVVFAAVAATVLVMLACTFGVHAHATLAHPGPLLSTLALLVGIASIVSALQAAELHHRHEAVIDPLTGLLNRHALGPRFVEIGLQARVSGHEVSLVLCDVDSFKAINDSYGHDVGDAVLRDVAYEMRKGLRSFELVYRLGGEEFLIVLPGIDLAGARLVAERIRTAVEALRPFGIDVTLSAGVSAAAGDQVDYEPLFKAADVALYEAKNGGRNRVAVARSAGAGGPFPAWSARTQSSELTDGVPTAPLTRS